MQMVDAIRAFEHPPQEKAERFITRVSGEMRSYDAVSENVLEPFSGLGMTEAEICEFATQFGHLGSVDAMVLSVPKTQIVTQGELVSFWRKEIQNLRDTYELYGAWRQKDLSELNKRVIWNSARNHTVVAYESPSGDRREIANSLGERERERMKQFDEGDVRGPAIFHVQVIVNKYLLEHTAAHLLWGMEFSKDSKRFVGLDPDHHAPSLF